MPSEPPRVHDDTNGALLGCVFVAQLLEGRLCGSQLREDGSDSPQRVFFVNVGLVDQSFECLPAVLNRFQRSCQTAPDFAPDFFGSRFL